MDRLLTIRRAQYAVFANERRRVLREETVQLIRTRFAAEWQRFGEEEVRALVALAFRKARLWRLVEYGDILRIVNVMFTLGCHFDEDPDYPWARAILARAELRPASRVDALVARTLAHLKEREAASRLSAEGVAR